MADSYALAMQKALIAHLKAESGVSMIVGARVYDQPPDSAPRPFLRIGGIIPRPLRSDCGRAATVTFSIEAHSRPEASGRVEATRCAEAVVAALDGAAMVVTGFDVVTLRWVTQTVESDADGKSYSAIVAFSTILDG